MTSYGIANQQSLTDTKSRHLEELQILGYTILDNVVDQGHLQEVRERLDRVYQIQEEESSKEMLETMGELNMARSPLSYDPFFVNIAAHPLIYDFAKTVLGPHCVLHLQNGIINHPAKKHHQTAWHRDLPYQEWTSSKPLALSALFCIDDFSHETGGTFVLPHSHQVENFPSETFVGSHELQVEARAGSVILFDSMLFHRAGHNNSNQIRRGINNMYVVPMISQQIDLPSALGGRFAEDPDLATLLGYTYSVPGSVSQWRKRQYVKKVNP